MLLSDAFLALGQDKLSQLVRGISMGKLRTFRLYDSFRTRAHLARVNTETVRKATPRFWARLSEKDEELARELAPAILMSHLDMIREVLDFTGIPNEDGFFAKDLDASPYLTPGWQQRVWERFRGAHPEPALLLYINHLAWELDKKAGVFSPSE